MPPELHTMLLSAVSPFDAGVSALKLKIMRDHSGSPERPNRTAAVLVPVLDKPEPEILLTVRSESLQQHPGQVSFPGGSADDTDRSAVSTALREAEEEIGLDFSQVSPLGFLDRLDTISDYRVLPVVGLVRPSFVWQPDHREVAEVFTVPLHLAVDHKQYSHQEVVYGGKTHVVSSLHWHGHRIWGITAAILLNFGRRIERSICEAADVNYGR
ncbi:MAG: CoA pyrophosphatase [Xanthomonadales bacterium]|nr:CoA pyrophosphatase [Gammaproteobacteria bacterium]NNK04448.1 CoA pyrophosphatase [Xanthomonadales bacterium]